jgi:hypothetical protein
LRKCTSIIQFLVRFQVKNELHALFDYIVHDFKEQTNIELILVLFVDDLDRCVGEGRSVKVLEAVQLVLNIPGAPIFVFTAIDSRIVVSTIETTLNRSMDLSDTQITGWEYLDKIVQIPFCIPEAPPEKVKRLVATSLTGNDSTAMEVAKRLRRMMGNLAELNAEKVQYSIEFIEADETTTKLYDPVDLRYLLRSGSYQEDTVFVSTVARKLTQSTIEAIKLAENLPIPQEGEEVVCRAVNLAINSFRVLIKDSTGTQTLSAAGKDKQDIYSQLQQQEEPALAGSEDSKVETRPNRLGFSADLIVKRIKNGFGQQTAVSPRVTQALESITNYIDPNPRRLKRIANILQLISEIAKVKTANEGSTEKLEQLPGWDIFMVKLVKWIVLCECWPYRMSFMVHVLMDFEQKLGFNSIQQSRVQGSVRYHEVAAHENESIGDLYTCHVEKYIYKHDGAKKFNRLDQDPEVFMAILHYPMAFDGRNIDINCKDVLGPLLETSPKKRDINFSLLAHSYNLNPALRNTIAGSMFLLTTENELERDGIEVAKDEKLQLRGESLLKSPSTRLAWDAGQK